MEKSVTEALFCLSFIFALVRNSEKLIQIQLTVYDVSLTNWNSSISNALRCQLFLRAAHQRKSCAWVWFCKRWCALLWWMFYQSEMDNSEVPRCSGQFPNFHREFSYFHRLCKFLTGDEFSPEIGSQEV